MSSFFAASYLSLSSGEGFSLAIAVSLELEWKRRAGLIAGGSVDKPQTRGLGRVNDRTAGDPDVCDSIQTQVLKCSPFPEGSRNKRRSEYY